MLWKIDNESGHPQLVQQDEVMKASTGPKCETQARAVHRILSGAVVKYPTKLNDISGTKAGFCVETVRRRIAEEIDLKKNVIDLLRNCFCWRCSRRRLRRNGHGDQIACPCCGKGLTQKRPQRGVCNAETMDTEKNPEWESPRKVGFQERSGQCSVDNTPLAFRVSQHETF